MSTEVTPEMKFTEEELKSLKELSNNYQIIQAEFGQVKLNRLNLEAKEAELEKLFEQQKQTEAKLMQELNDKYGPGVLDPATGVFTPSSK